MRHGFVKAAAVTPRIKVADTEYNAEQVCRGIGNALAGGAKIIVFPELCLTGYTCGDLFLQELLLEQAKEALRLAMHKLPCKCKVVSKADLEGGVEE